jgi:ABC-type antimicrobial peptide transport system permease subunit
MLCVERLQWLIQAFILGLVMYLIGVQMFQWALIVLFAMMIMLSIAGLTGFCPGRLFLKQVFPLCGEKGNN